MASLHQIQRTNLRWLSRLTWFVLGLIEISLAARFVLKLLKPKNLQIANILNKITDPLVAPFMTIAIMWSTIIAMAAYLLLAWAITSLLSLPSESVKKREYDHSEYQNSIKISDNFSTRYPRYFDDEPHYQNYSLHSRQPRRL